MALKQKITNTTIKNLTIEQGRLNDTEISGFHARISPKGIVKYYLYYRLNGKQRNFLLGAATSLTPAQARDLVKEKAGQVASGEDVHESRNETRKQEQRKGLTLERFLEEYYKDYLIGLNPKQAEKSYISIKNGFAHLAKKPIADITAFEVQQWVTERSKLGRAPSTITSVFNRFKAAMNRAVEWELLEGHNLDKVKLIKRDNTLVRYLSKEQESALFEQIQQRDERLRQEQCNRTDVMPTERYIDYFEPLIVMAVNTGMRKGEMLSLRWEHVSMENRYLTISSENAKSKKKRTIPLNDTLYNMLETWREQHPDTEHVLVHMGKSVDYFQHPWEQVLKGSKIENFRFHDLRHHFASKLVMAGVDLNIVRELLGHSDLKMTLRYAHLAPEQKAAAISLIG
ncbi:site-specific integrase [Vibrio methylphosphonaticus]|uniref:site-specific integrase n=1 Tax=Vibrio methylphosphonaticus TaxID=2946866 RepID=UPI00202A2F39|nr:site-specific integrase [Vibrio methylphosphonaticus]MCL9777543.1 site-specific integrase [Vibrio methylphosphonaticus]